MHKISHSHPAGKRRSAQKPEGFFEKTAVHRPDFMIRYMLNDHLEGGNDPWWSLCVLWVSPASAATR